MNQEQYCDQLHHWQLIASCNTL